ncbi:hypothetical protein IEQ34_000176 [Dendrobium chrysotoxum]|uniref:Uncharacterized protein n=1 Tax=Dendrobium chrysotoxum TaxID=161865 RepID=A0AAV7HS57_DENCH|nr:hypothetical protein IEQ34_000176 [Dendrobium chrysotoxum]
METGWPTPLLVVGNSTNSKLHITPIPNGSTSNTSSVLFAGHGYKHLTTFLSLSATAAKTSADSTAWMQSMNLNLYPATSTAEESTGSKSQMPRRVARPWMTRPSGRRRLSVKQAAKAEAARRRSREMVMSRVVESQEPLWVKTGVRSWKARSVPVGRRLARWAVPARAWERVGFVRAEQRRVGRGEEAGEEEEEESGSVFSAMFCDFVDLIVAIL